MQGVGRSNPAGETFWRDARQDPGDVQRGIPSAQDGVHEKTHFEHIGMIAKSRADALQFAAGLLEIPEPQPSFGRIQVPSRCMTQGSHTRKKVIGRKVESLEGYLPSARGGLTAS